MVKILSDTTLANVRQIIATDNDGTAWTFLARVPADNIVSAHPVVKFYGETVAIADPWRYGESFGPAYVRAFFGENS